MDLKIEKISDNMIKVTISLKELEERDIDFQSLARNPEAAQELLWDMMELAEMQYGFDFSNVHVAFEPICDFIEGFIITITQIDEDMDFEFLHRHLKNKIRRRSVKTNKRARRIIYPVKMVYCFESLEDVCDLAGKIHDKYSGDSSLYKLANRYYLFLESTQPINYTKLELLSGEYGRRIRNTVYYEGYLNEYGDIMIKKDAINILYQYFTKA